jgi:two-component system, sensor histidine kinase and response regulator
MTAGCRILLAEDSAVNQMLAVALLQKMGHAVTVAADGHQALAAFGREAFDLILMDVQMPGMDGFAATAAVREVEKKTGRRVPIIAMTAPTMKEDRERCLAAGMDDYIAKPIRTEELAAVIARHRPASADSGGATQPAESAAPEGDTTFAADTRPVNRQELLVFLHGDEELLARLVRVFHAQHGQLLLAVREAVDRRDAVALERAAHTLKGAVSVFRAKHAAEAALRLELMGRRSELSGAEKAYRTLEAEIGKVVVELGILVR